MEDYLGFIRNFDIKIPDKSCFDYYIDILSKSGEYSSLKDLVSLWTDYEKSLGGDSPKKDKALTIVKSVSHFKELIGDSILEYAESRRQNEFYKSNFVPDDNKFYISFDVRQGNWTVIRRAIGKDLPDWEEYVQTELSFHPVLAKSKGLRQAILGQSAKTKNYAAILKSFTAENLALLKENGFESKIVGINDEEIHLEIGADLDSDMVKSLQNIEWTLPVKATLFKVNFKTNFGNHVRVDSFYDPDTLDFKYERLWGNGGDGNRFYIHFKTLILKEEIDHRDLLIKKDGLYFQWCGDDYHDITESKWIERWIKPLVKFGGTYYIGDVDGDEYARTNESNIITFSDGRTKLCENKDEVKSFIKEHYLNEIKSYFNI